MQKQLHFGRNVNISAEISSFGQNKHISISFFNNYFLISIRNHNLWPNPLQIHLYSIVSHPEFFVEMLKQGQTYRVYSYFGRNMPISAEIAMFRPKQVYICRNKTISAEYSVSAEFRFFEMGCFGFRCFGKKSVSVGHYLKL